MTVEIRATPLADKIIEGPAKKTRNAYDQFKADLATRGCAALAYQLSGGFLDHQCVVHLTAQLRVIVAFESPEIAYVVLIGNHDRDRPQLDVYRQAHDWATGEDSTPPADHHGCGGYHPCPGDLRCSCETAGYCLRGRCPACATTTCMTSPAST